MIRRVLSAAFASAAAAHAVVADEGFVDNTEAQYDAAANAADAALGDARFAYPRLGEVAMRVSDALALASAAIRGLGASL